MTVRMRCPAKIPGTIRIRHDVRPDGSVRLYATHATPIAPVDRLLRLIRLGLRLRLGPKLGPKPKLEPVTVDPKRLPQEFETLATHEGGIWVMERYLDALVESGIACDLGLTCREVPSNETYAMVRLAENHDPREPVRPVSQT